MAYIYDLADTWNASGTTFTGIGLNVTDTASAAGSLLMDLQVGGSTRLRVNKAGSLEIASDAYIGDFSGTRFRISNGASPFITLGGGVSGYFGLANSNIQVADVRLFRDAAGVLAQRNGANAQAFNLYNTFTDASNYERGFMRWVGNVLQIGSDKLGTGIARALAFQTDGTTRLTLATTGDATFTASVLSSTAFPRYGGASGIVLSAGATDLIAVVNNSTTLQSGAIVGWSGSIATAAQDTALVRSAAGVLGVRGANATTGGSVELIEQTAPATPSLDRVRIYAEDNGAGKTRLMALFATGVAQQIAIEP